jgi:hypothetical protein
MSVLIVLTTGHAFYVINGTFHIHTHTQITRVHLTSSHIETNSATKPLKQINNNNNNNKDEITVGEF